MIASRKIKKSLPLSIDVELVCRQYGGGAAAGKVDLDQWLRPSAVRGALRFWWRALNAHRYTSIAELRAGEGELFGTQAAEGLPGPGKLGVTVVAIPRKPGECKPWSVSPGDALGGAYFPAQGMGREPSALLEPGASASISIDYIGLTEGQQNQIRHALAAYILFGGSGARTRRGAGALCLASADDARRIGAPYNRESLEQWCREIVRERSPLEVFCIGSRVGIYLAADTHKSGEKAQQNLLKMWREFRQDRKHPETWTGSKDGDWGRTQWPEADAIRLLADTHARWEDGTNHEPETRNAKRAPRAHLGLPIGMKFKDDNLKEFDRDSRQWVPKRPHPTRGRLLSVEPQAVELVATGKGRIVSERYASPVMLSIACIGWTPVREYVGIVLVTPSLLKTKVSMKSQKDNEFDPGPWSIVEECLTRHLDGAHFTKIG